MFLNVPKGKNVSNVCRVISDPVSQITWYFNGMPLAEEEPTVLMQVSNMTLLNPAPKGFQKRLILF